MDFDDLPAELQREIFEIAARNDLNDARTLLTVERKVYHWIYPILFEVIVHDNTHDFSKQFYVAHGHQIHHLLLHRSGDTALSVMACPNVHDLALWLSHITPQIRTYIEKITLWRLSANLQVLYGSAAGFQRSAQAHSPFLSNITHLEVVNNDMIWSDWNNIALLPKLTHLSFVDEVSRTEMIQGALDNCKRLRILARVSVPALRLENGVTARWVEDALEDDSRVVSFECEFKADWEAGAFGQRDMWTMAEEIVENRLQKLFSKAPSNKGPAQHHPQLEPN